MGEGGRLCTPGVEGEVTAGGARTEAIGYLRADGTIEPIRGQTQEETATSPVKDEGRLHSGRRTAPRI